MVPLPSEAEENATKIEWDDDQKLLRLLLMFKEQNNLKLEGVRRISNRIVSLDDPDARPIRKGKKHPGCEFGTTEQFSFNREGYMLTCAIYIGKASDKTIYAETVDEAIRRVNRKFDISVTDKGYRSRDNRTYGDIPVVFMGQTSDVSQEYQEYCSKARSATEGFIAIAKNCRGFKRSLHWEITGHKVWSKLCQMAYNLKKFFQLYKEEGIEEQVLINLGLLGK